MKSNTKLSKALTWNELADEYYKKTGQSAKIRPMDAIFEWAESQKKKFYVDPKEGTIHKISKYINKLAV